MVRVSCVGAAILALLCCLAPAASADGSGKVVELPVSFRVHNTDTSGAVCPTDGANYTVSGHITAARASLSGRAPRTLAVYLTGLDTGEWGWRLTAVPGYDWPAEIAHQGQSSLTLDMLGYGASGHPNGQNSCYGSQADVVHQVIGELRRGDYRVDGGRPLTFSRIALVGHDVGGAIAEIEAYSYKDIDALVLMTWADQGFTPLLLDRFGRAASACATGGGLAQPGGYFYMERPEEYQPDLFFDADPAVIAAVQRLREPNPCGYNTWAFSAITSNLARLGEIHVPVLLTIGAQDTVWTSDGWALQQQHFTGSRDVTAARIPNASHFPMLERTAPQARALVGGWLGRRGFGRPPCGRAHVGNASPTA
jgi:pimeloyl-ACP methyl ester carboxylesterase